MVTEPEKPEATGLDRSESSFARRVWIAVTIITVVLLALFVLWNARSIVLVVFAGGLFGIFLHSIGHWLHKNTGITNKAAVILTVVVMVVLLGLAGWYAAPSIASQARQLGPELESGLESLQERLGGIPLVQQVGGDGDLLERLINTGTSMLGQVTGFFTTTVGFITNIVVLLFVGIYFAYEPDLYIDGVLKLAPPEHRARLRDVIEEIHETMRWWLAGRLVLMPVIAALTTGALLLLDIPLALVLGILTGILEFIPYFGPLLALAPALLIGLTMGTTTALYVVLAYLAVQFLEGYILTPFVEKKAVSLPPVLLISSQLVLGAVLGFWGLLLAPPLVETGRVIVKKLYVEDMLGDRSVHYVSEEHNGDE